ncbi:hypothetical protein N657DRAFT_44076 [Parathielavia appendiculata]|uniref:Uncharacterized protein n=1 Tax=Parathielavia appendiculata TaxID=2587402 RepID=A0AAN6U9I9_9PEZI|nr:hypothetical protein N657DRAFT_44076 [Parathielavia appendiculata]
MKGKQRDAEAGRQTRQTRAKGERRKSRHRYLFLSTLFFSLCFCQSQGQMVPRPSTLPAVPLVLPLPLTSTPPLNSFSFVSSFSFSSTFSSFFPSFSSSPSFGFSAPYFDLECHAFSRNENDGVDPRTGVTSPLLQTSYFSTPYLLFSSISSSMSNSRVSWRRGQLGGCANKETLRLRVMRLWVRLCG